MSWCLFAKSRADVDKTFRSVDNPLSENLLFIRVINRSRSCWGLNCIDFSLLFLPQPVPLTGRTKLVKIHLPSYWKSAGYKGETITVETACMAESCWMTEYQSCRWLAGRDISSITADFKSDLESDCLSPKVGVGSKFHTNYISVFKALFPFLSTLEYLHDNYIHYFL